jgi:hypothetical protein
MQAGKKSRSPFRDDNKNGNGKDNNNGRGYGRSSSLKSTNFVEESAS